MMGVKKKNILRLLLLLETTALALFVGALVGFRIMENYEMVLLVMGVCACEAAVGLGVLISLARVKGRDFTEVRLAIKI